MKPLITVVTPAYNSMSTIFQTIDSVLSQTYPQIQYIISDDHSENFNFEDITNYLKAYNKGNVVDFKVVQTHENVGISKNLNYGLSFAIGKYLFNLAADDAFYDDYVLDEWVQKFEDTGAQVITASRAVYDADLATKLYVAPTDEEKTILNNSTPAELFEAMTGYNIVFGCCTARSKSNYDLIDGYDERYQYIEDYPANMKTLRQSISILFWDRIVIKYRKGGISSSGGLSKQYLKESDNIFQNEILPYTSNKKMAKRRYKSWKSIAIFMSDKNKLASKICPKDSLLSKIFIYVILAFMHPIVTLGKIKKILFKR